MMQESAIPASFAFQAQFIRQPAFADSADSPQQLPGKRPVVLETEELLQHRHFSRSSLK